MGAGNVKSSNVNLKRGDVQELARGFERMLFAEEEQVSRVDLFKSLMTQMIKPADTSLYPEELYGGLVCCGRYKEPPYSLRAYAEVDLSAISHNARVLQETMRKSNARLLPVLKANAYGHGAVPVAHMLHKCNGVDCIAVAEMEEAIQLRDSGLPVTVRILVLGPPLASEITLYSKFGLDLMLSRGEFVDELEAWADRCQQEGTLKHPIACHVMLNTGMSRIGLNATDEKYDSIVQSISEDCDVVTRGSSGASQTYHGVDFSDCAALVKRLDALDDNVVEFQAVCTHLSEAEPGSDYTSIQFNRARSAIEQIRAMGVSIPWIHLENSASMLFDLIADEEFIGLLSGNPNGEDSIGYSRSGGGLYGQRPIASLKPCLTLKATVRHVHYVVKGTPVGYDRSWIAPDDVYIATLSIGFADGYNRMFSNALDYSDPALKTLKYGKGGVVGINGKLFKVAGKVCMDMMMVNCENDDSIKVGDVAVLFGDGGMPLADAAKLIGTAQSDLTCDLSQRTRLLYVNAPSPPP